MPMHFEKDKAGKGAQKQGLGKLGALKAKQVSGWGGYKMRGGVAMGRPVSRARQACSAQSPSWWVRRCGWVDG